MLDVILIYRILYGKSIAATHLSHSTSNRTDVWNFYCRLLVPRTSWFLQELVIPRTNPPLLSILKHIAQQIRVGLITGYITSKLTKHPIFEYCETSHTMVILCAYILQTLSSPKVWGQKTVGRRHSTFF